MLKVPNAAKRWQLLVVERKYFLLYYVLTTENHLEMNAIVEEV
jgi:hypothetical protein